MENINEALSLLLVGLTTVFVILYLVVLIGNGVIRFMKIDSEEIIEYFVSGDKMEVVDIPTGYTHNIENLGDTDMVTIMWANEPFDPEKPDTYFLEV